VAYGCVFGCLWCPLRSHLSGEPPELVADLPERLERELRARKRSGALPQEVLLNLTTDSFQPLPALLTLTHEAARLLLEAGCDVYLRTRGVVPDGFGELFRAHAPRVHVEVVLFSLERELLALYEPGAPSPRERLETIRRLCAWGVQVQARIEPLIPFVSDTVGHLEELLRHIRSAGAERAAVAYLVLQPRILERLEAQLPSAHQHLIKGSFRGQPWKRLGPHRDFRWLPERTRRDGYQRLRALAKRAGVEVRVCACQNPGLGEPCHQAPGGGQDAGRAGGPAGQLDLFSGA